MYEELYSDEEENIIESDIDSISSSMLVEGVGILMIPNLAIQQTELYMLMKTLQIRYIQNRTLLWKNLFE